MCQLFVHPKRQPRQTTVVLTFKHLTRQLFSILLIPLLIACVEPVEVKITSIGGEVIISGQISTLEDQSSVVVATTADTERLPIPLSGAIVTLFEDNEALGLYTEDGSLPGRYLLQGHVGKADRSYFIKVTLPDKRAYYSAAEKMKGDAGSVSSYFEIANEETVDNEGAVVVRPCMKIFTNASLPAIDGRYIQWSVDEVYIIVPYSPPTEPVTRPPCFVTQPADPQKIILFDRQYVTATEISDKFLVRRVIDQTFLYKHYFVTYQSSLSAEAFAYWSKVNTLVSGNGSIFDTPPARIYGNIRRNEEEDVPEKVFGYFQAVNQSVSRVFVNRSELPFFLNYSDCQGNNPARWPAPSYCENCLSVRNSSHVRPPWF